MCSRDEIDFVMQIRDELGVPLAAADIAPQTGQRRQGPKGEVVGAVHRFFSGPVDSDVDYQFGLR